MVKPVRIMSLGPSMLVLILCSFSVYAAKPDQQHERTSPPLRGVMVTCNASNLTAEPLDVYFDVANQDGDYTEGWSTIPPGEVVGWTQFNNMMTSWSYCTFSWFGQKDDVKGTICLHDNDPPFPPYSCLAAD